MRHSGIRILILSTCLVRVFSGQSLPSGGLSPAERQCLAEALQLLQKHALPDAESTLVNCQRQHRDSAVLNNALGIVYEQEGRKSDAVGAFEKALGLLPSFTAAQIHLGTLYAGMGKCDNAKRLLNAAASATTDSGALVTSGIGLAECHDFSAAIQVLESALQSNPSSVAATYNLSLAQFQSNDFSACLRTLNLLPQSEQTTDPDVLFLRGKALQGARGATVAYDRSRDEDIAGLFSNSCKLRAQGDYCVQAALELIHQERFGDADKLLENALREVPANAPIFSALGLALFRLGKYNDAMNAYTKAINMDSSLEAPREGLAFLLYMTGDLEQARSVVEAGIRQSHADFYLLYLQALILYRQSPKLLPDAFAAVSTAIKKNPKFAPAYFLRGKIQSDQSDQSAALADFQAAVRIDPGYSLPYYRLARIYAAMGRLSDSQQAARQFTLLGSAREDDLLARQATDRLTMEHN